MIPPVVLPASAGHDAEAHLTRLASGPFSGCELRAPADDVGWSVAAQATGWRDEGVRERWRGALEPREADADFVPLAECGREAFTARLTNTLRQVEDVRFGRDGDALFAAWLPLRPGEPQLWGLLPGGVVVPRLVEPEVGALLFIGVVPERIGTGLGRRLHDAALANLWCAGARIYEDEIDALNTPMRALLERAGLERVASWRSLVRGT